MRISNNEVGKEWEILDHGIQNMGQWGQCKFLDRQEKW